MYRAFIGKIRKGKEKEYVEAHKQVWPELIDAMMKAGVENQSCFVFENHICVYLEAQDIDATMDRLARDPINQKWDVFMQPLLERPGDSSNELFPEMCEVHRMEASDATPRSLFRGRCLGRTQE
ncbi:MAG: L-rhamnose mutarotase [Candidatus Sulfotelmatobacter sp.]